MTDSYPKANSRIVFREEFDDSAILFDPDSGDACALNHTGIVIWRFLDGNHSVSDIVAEVQACFNNVPSSANNHVGRFIQELIQKKFAC